MTKLPERDQWWRSNEDGQIAYICGFNFAGDPVYQTKEVHDFRLMSAFLEEWHHEPLCTGFDWQPPVPIDPGEGWELLPVGTVREREDEFTRDAGKTWNGTKCYGERIPSDSLLTYRRRKPPAEVWPKYYVGEMWTDADAYLRIDNAELDGVWVGEDGDEIKYRKHDERTLQDRITEHKLREVTEAEALARVKPVEPIAQAVDSKITLAEAREAASRTMAEIEAALCLAESPDDWVTLGHEYDQHVLRAGVDQISSPIGGPWTSITTRPMIGLHGKILGEERSNGLYEFRCRRKDLPPLPESPDDWVEITDTHPGHIRRACDEVCRNPPNWIPVRSSIGMPQSDFSFTRIRCRRRDLPAPPAPIEQERWFMWSDDRYPIAFVKRAGGKVFNLNVDGLFKTSDDWGPSYEEKLINGELIEVTEASAKAYLRRPRRKIIDPPAPQPKRTPVRLGIQKNGVVFAVKNPAALDEHQEIKCDGSGFYVKGGE